MDGQVVFSRTFNWWDNVNVVNATRERQAGQIIPGKDKPTNSITPKATTPIASEIIVSADRIMTVLISLAILLLLNVVFYLLPLCSHMFVNL